MLDDWEDWEEHNFIPTLNNEQLRILEERKLVEESDNKLTKDLFSNEDEDLVHKNLKQESVFVNQLHNTEKKTPNRKNYINNQKVNEEKQKILSKLIKQKKADKQREKELFGEAENDEYNKYAEYEDMFY